MPVGLETAALLTLVSAGATAYSAYSSSQTASKNRESQEKIAADAIANKPQATKAPGAGIGAAASALSADPSSSQGNGGTFLTGSSGVDPGGLNLGKNTLLGQ